MCDVTGSSDITLGTGTRGNSTQLLWCSCPKMRVCSSCFLGSPCGLSKELGLAWLSSFPDSLLRAWGSQAYCIPTHAFPLIQPRLENEEAPASWGARIKLKVAVAAPRVAGVPSIAGQYPVAPLSLCSHSACVTAIWTCCPLLPPPKP